MKRYIIVAAAAVMTMFQACETLSVDETPSTPPVITSFSPMSAPAGAEIIVEGEYLNGVTKAYIGDVEVEIIQKVSDKRLSIEVARQVTSGKIILENEYGAGKSADVFSCTYAVPEILDVQSEADYREQILITGKNLNSAASVVFTSAEDEGEGHEAAIVTRTDNEMVVIVPYVKGELAVVTMSYYTESGLAYTSSETAPKVKVVKYPPTFADSQFEKTAVGSSVTFTGEYLANVDSVTVRRVVEGQETKSYRAIISASDNSLTVTIPAADFPDGDSQAEITAWWFEGNESKTFDPLDVYVPFVYYWQDITTECQGRMEDFNFTSFFSPQTGIVYQNSEWQTLVDPVAMKYKNESWTSANIHTPGVISDEEYDSVNPYFFFSAVSGNVIQINSPANSNQQIRNFFVDATSTPGDNYRVPGGKIDIPGTPVLAFHYLNPNSSSQAEKELRDRIVNAEIDKFQITPETFPIDLSSKTIAGVAVTMKGAIKSSSWCDHQTTVLEDDPDYMLDAVFLVAYYHNNGYSADDMVSKIKRLGFIRVKEIDWRVYNASTPNYGGTTVRFDCWWQKQDYEYPQE